MNVALIAAPAASAFAPPLSIIALRPYLQAHGISATPIDANIDAIHWALQPDRFWSYVEPILPSLKKGLPKQMAQAIHSDRVVGEDHQPPPLNEDRALQVRDALETLWRDDGFAMTKADFLSQLSTLDDALILSSLRMFPHHLKVWNDYGNVISPNADQYSPYVHYCRDALVPRIAELGPDLIGLSVTHGDQLLCSIYLVHALRTSGVTTPIVLGGSHFSQFARIGGQEDTPVAMPLADRTGRPKPELAILSSLLGGMNPYTKQLTESDEATTVGVRQEGEQPLLHICRRLSSGEGLDDLDNVVRIDRSDNTIVFNPVGPNLPGHELPRADLSGLGIGRKYITPVPTAPLMTSRGCYWDKCAFCDHAHVLGQGYRMLDVDVVADSMASYKDDFGVEVVLFADEALSPSMVRRLTDKLEERGLHLPYESMCRVDEGFIPLIERAARWGLKGMCFGWESACDRVVGKMNKGYTREVSERLIDECRRHDVLVQLFVMMGFPTETQAEAEETVDFLLEDRGRIAGVNIMPWRLTPGCHINAHWADYGLIAQPGALNLGDAASFALSEGISRKQALGVIQRMRAHPGLQRFFGVKGFEDYRIIIDAVRAATSAEPPSSYESDRPSEPKGRPDKPAEPTQPQPKL